MKQKIFWAVTLICLTLAVGCDRADRQQAERKAEEARVKARELGRKAEQEAEDLKRNADSQDLRMEGDQAGRKLDRAATIAKVKAKLADDVGLSTVTGIEVDATAHSVTLRGNVDSAERKEEAGRAAAEVAGVTKVVNELQVQR